MTFAFVVVAASSEEMGEDEGFLYMFKRLLLFFIMLDEVVDTLMMEYFISKTDCRRKCGLFFSVISNFLIAFILQVLMGVAFGTYKDLESD